MTKSSSQLTVSKFAGIIHIDAHILMDDCFVAAQTVTIELTEFGKKYFASVPNVDSAIYQFKAFETIELIDVQTIIEKGTTLSLIRGGLATNSGILVLLDSL